MDTGFLLHFNRRFYSPFYKRSFLLKLNKKDFMISIIAPAYNEEEIIKDFIDVFIKGKNALPNAETFTIIPSSSNGDSKLIIGYQNINTNTIQMKIDALMNGEISPVTFSAKSFKEVLSANKDFGESNLEVSEDGIAKIEFKNKENEFVYYLAANDEQ